MDVTVSIGILGLAPRIGPSRFHSFQHFQKLVGSFETLGPQFWSAHAAVHALMNGIDRIVLRGLQALDRQNLEQSLEDLLDFDPYLDLIVLPDPWDPNILSKALPHHSPIPLAFSAPRDWSITQIQDLAPRNSGYWVGPWIKTLSPGCRQSILIPGACLFAPLFLKTAPYLKGIHQTPSPPLDPHLKKNLEKQGIAWIETHGPFHKPYLSYLTKPQPKKNNVQEEWRIKIENECLMFPDLPQGPKLRKSIERKCHALLMNWKRQGIIKDYHLRCEESNHSPHPIVWITLIFPQRVQSFHIHLNRFDS